MLHKLVKSEAPSLSLRCLRRATTPEQDPFFVLEAAFHGAVVILPEVALFPG